MQVTAIFVNIFGGIIRCDEIAKGIIAAAKESNLKIPIVVRLQGRNFPPNDLDERLLFPFIGNRQRKASALIEGSGLKMIGVEDFDKAAKTVSIHA